jgi:hypothetical protein
MKEEAAKDVTLEVAPDRALEAQGKVEARIFLRVGFWLMSGKTSIDSFEVIK